MKSRKNQGENQHNEPPPQRIQERAYELYVNRGQEPGHELDDWLKAEGELSHKQEHATLVES